MDKEKLKSALDSFEAEDFVGARETIRQEIKTAKAEYLANKLGIDSDVLIGSSSDSEANLEPENNDDE